MGICPSVLVDRQVIAILDGEGFSAEQIEAGRKAAYEMYRNHTYAGSVVHCCIEEARRAAALEPEEEA